MRIKRVQIDPEYVGPETRSFVEVEKWFRGHYEGLHLLTNFEDPEYILLDHLQEEPYLKALEKYVKPPMRIEPNTVRVPPIMKLHLQQKWDVNVDRIPQVSVEDAEDSHFSRVAEAGEEANVSLAEFDGIGCTPQAFLYDGLDFSCDSNPPCPKSV